MRHRNNIHTELWFCGLLVSLLLFNNTGKCRRTKSNFSTKWFHRIKTFRTNGYTFGVDARVKRIALIGAWCNVHRPNRTALDFLLFAHSFIVHNPHASVKTLESCNKNEKNTLTCWLPVAASIQRSGKLKRIFRLKLLF